MSYCSAPKTHHTIPVCCVSGPVRDTVNPNCLVATRPGRRHSEPYPYWSNCLWKLLGSTCWRVSIGTH